MSSRLVRCTNAGIIHDVVRHFFTNSQGTSFERIHHLLRGLCPLPFSYQASEYELHLFDFNDLRFIVTRLSISLAMKFKNVEEESNSSPELLVAFFDWSRNRGSIPIIRDRTQKTVIPRRLKHV